MDNQNLSFNDKIGILDPAGLNPNPLTGEPYSATYKALAKMWKSLPAYAKAQEVIESIADNQLTFIVSGTGSGKSVLIPKYALHYTGYQGKVGMTLPKKVVTLSSADFAAKTLDIQLGKEIGYVYKGSNKSHANSSNRMLYMTDGTLIMKFTRDPLLSEFKIIIIDEAHERKVQIDLIMLFLKNLLQSGQRPDLRVIIMSATIDVAKYQAYFDGVTSNSIDISGQPNHEIIVHFLDQPAKSYLTEGLQRIDDLVTKSTKGDILFFITTSNEALQLCKDIRPKYPRVYCIEVYADMDSSLKLYAESRDSFMELGNYNQKLVMATNVAESSLTIDGLKYVIDSGYELTNYFSPEFYGRVLEKRLITRAQALQRRGRVGRTEPGICYTLLTRLQFDSLEEFPEPNILKEDITMDLLKIIKTSESQTLQEGISLLSQLMDPPRRSFIDVAIDIYQLYNLVDTEGHLTPAGNAITEFSSNPVNRTLFLINAYGLRCAREAAIILAMMDALKGKLTNLFYKTDTLCNTKMCDDAKKLVKKLAQRHGDHITFLKIFFEFKKADDQKKWARKYGIRLDILNKADKEFGTYFYKILNIFRQPQTGGTVPGLDNVCDSFVGAQGHELACTGGSGGDTQRKTPSYDLHPQLIERLTQALKQSHLHLTAKKSRPAFGTASTRGTVSKDSSLYYFYNTKQLATKNIIYDEFININGSWEFSTVTII